MLPGLFFQWVRAAVTQQVIAAAQAEVQSELTARAAAASEGPLPCQVGIVTAEPLESEALEAMLQRPAKFISEGLTIVQGILAINPQNRTFPRHSVSSAESGDDLGYPPETKANGTESTNEGAVSGIRIAIARAGHGRHAARRAVESLIAGHTPRCVIAAGFCTGLHRQMRAGDLLVANSLVLYNPETVAYDSEISLSETESETDSGPESTDYITREAPSSTLALTATATEGDGSSGDGVPQTVEYRVNNSRDNEGNSRGKSSKKPRKKKAAAKRAPRLHRGALVTTHRVSTLPKTPTAKRLLAGLSDAIAADTESEAIVVYCLKRRIPVLVLRGVRESVHETFAEEIRHYQQKDTTLGRLGSMLGAFLDREGAFTELNRWNRRGHDVSQRLAEAIVGIVCPDQPKY
ncbi:MAG: hypothetical protein PHE53_05685 [Thermoguttaceae bacterium]|nr:hypothetical protein [Thermoguttaceae bacterium]